jgi:hypothetical protein
VFERYNIVSESDLADAAQKIEFGHHSGIIAEPEQRPQPAPAQRNFTN